VAPQWMLFGRIECANWHKGAAIRLHSGYCVAVWSVIYPHFLPFFLPASLGRARIYQHRIKSIFGFDSVIALFSDYWIKIIRKYYFSFWWSQLFSSKKKVGKKELAPVVLQTT